MAETSKMISGRRPQRILGCPICGYRVDPTDRVCPRCGSEFYEGTKFECPLCGGLVSSDQKSCPACHVDYSDFREKTISRGSDDDIDTLLTEIIDLESNQLKKEDKRYSCPECGWMLDGSENKCPRCNHDLVADLSFQCPVCGMVVNSSTRICPECGSNFEEPEAAPAPPQQEPMKVERKTEAAADFLRASEQASAPPPPVEPIKVVRRTVVAKPATEERSPEPSAPTIEPPTEPVMKEPAVVEPERLELEPESAIAKPAQPQVDEEKTTEELTAPQPNTPKKAAKRRKLKSKP